MRTNEKEPEINSISARYGLIYLFSDNDLISTAVRTYGEWAQIEINCLSRFIKPSDVVLDIGACIGTHAIAFSNFVTKSGEVYAFEPDITNFTVLQKNAEVAGRKNIHIQRVAVSSKSGFANLIHESENAGAGHLVLGHKAGSESGDEVLTITLDEKSWDRIDLIKMDVEGHEPSVLLGGIETLRKHRPVLHLEVNSLEVGAECLRAIVPCGYQAFGGVCDAFNSNNFFGVAADIFNGGKECSLLCIHEDHLDNWRRTIEEAGLQPVNTVDDLARLLIQKPQYWVSEFSEVAEQCGLTISGEAFSVNLEDKAVGHELAATKVELENTGHELAATKVELENTGRKLAGATEGEKALKERLDLKLGALRRSEADSQQANVRLEAQLREIQTLNASNEDLRKSLRRLADINEETLALLERAQHEWGMAMKVVRKAQKFPASIYFKLRKKYRRMIRALIRQDAPLLTGMREQTTRMAKARAFLHDFDRGEEIEDQLAPDELALMSEYFDAAYYLSYNPDVAADSMDPFSHFVQTGWSEKRNPNAWFDIDYYLSMSPQLDAMAENPFLHYLRHGRYEGMFPAHPAGKRVFMIGTAKKGTPFTYPAINPLRLGSQGLVELLRPALAASRNRMQLSFIHSDWHDSVGGTEVCMHIEAKACAKIGVAHLSVYPVIQPSKIAPQRGSEELAFGVSLNGERIGIARYYDIIDAMTQVQGEGANIESTIHQLLGHQPEKVGEVIKATGNPKARFYLHDYLSICQQWNLLRNDIIYCNGPSINSGACGICKYGKERQAHLARFAMLFSAIDIEIIAPSEVALETWAKSTDLRVSNMITLPHATLAVEPRETLRNTDYSAPARIGFVGAPVLNKGWDAFLSVFDKYQDDPRFSFHVFGSWRPKMPSGIVFHEAKVTPIDHTAMTRAITAADVDMIIHFAPWPETFSLTAFEALGAGAFLVASKDSGNVADIVLKTGRGVVLSDQAELTDWFDRDAFIQLLDERRSDANRNTIRLEYSDMAMSQAHEALDQ